MREIQIQWSRECLIRTLLFNYSHGSFRIKLCLVRIYTPPIQIFANVVLQLSKRAGMGWRIFRSTCNLRMGWRGNHFSCVSMMADNQTPRSHSHSEPEHDIAIAPVLVSDQWLMNDLQWPHSAWLTWRPWRPAGEERYRSARPSCAGTSNWWASRH